VSGDYVFPPTYGSAIAAGASCSPAKCTSGFVDPEKFPGFITDCVGKRSNEACQGYCDVGYFDATTQGGSRTFACGIYGSIGGATGYAMCDLVYCVAPTSVPKMLRFQYIAGSSRPRSVAN
jgi:hypothetical protein